MKEIDGGRVTLELWMEKADGRKAVVGEARAELPQV